jgi:aldehyde dehydrogenase (NAD+)
MEKILLKIIDEFELKDLDTIRFTKNQLDKSEISQKNIIPVISPINGSTIAQVKQTTKSEYEQIVSKLKKEQKLWKNIPAPRRGELIRIFGEELRKSKSSLGKLVTIETGKILQEGLGEVQEMIDICDFAVGLSRQLYGYTMPSERHNHRLQELWHPLGVVGIISSFNFPTAVWSWNFTLSTICGNTTLWKPSPKTPITSIVCERIWKRALKKSEFKDSNFDLLRLVQGHKEPAEWIANDDNINLVSMTGSTEMGRKLGKNVTERFGKSIMELGGNNAMIVTPSANMQLALQAIIFSSAGTCGQRCTSLRRLFVHESIIEDMKSKIKNHFIKLKIGNPFDKETVVGPIISQDAFDKMQEILQKCKLEGGKITGGERIDTENVNAFYVRPAIVEFDKPNYITKLETFAPILYIISYRNLDEAIEMHNDVGQGLSSCIFSQDLLETEKFVSANGSDCGIVNVNIGPSGAEIGGAFGGEKESGGGRESGSDAWKAYMRRVTVTINYSTELPLSQGIKFNFE